MKARTENGWTRLDRISVNILQLSLCLTLMLKARAEDGWTRLDRTSVNIL
jgi:hypothetical protein